MLGDDKEGRNGNQFVHILTPTGKISQDSNGSMTNERTRSVRRGENGDGKPGRWENGMRCWPTTVTKQC